MRKIFFIIGFIFFFLASIATEVEIKSIHPKGPIIINNKELYSGTFDSKAKFKINDDQKVVLRSFIFPKGKKTIEGSKFNKTHATSLAELYEYKSQTITHGVGDIRLEHAEQKPDFLTEKRIAIIIGNAAYLKYPNLPSCIDNAIDVTQKLSSLGFDTYTFYNLDNISFRNALKEFFADVSNYDVALFYYSGHGVQNDQKQYIVPTNANFRDSKELIEQCISLEEINSLLYESGVKEKLIFMDACRNQPSWATDSYSGEKEKANRSYIVLASDRDEEAFAADNEFMTNSPFTSAFLDIVGRHFNNVDDAVREIRKMLVENNYPNPVVINGGTNFTFVPDSTYFTFQDIPFNLSIDEFAIRLNNIGYTYIETIGNNCMKFKDDEGLSEIWVHWIEQTKQVYMVEDVRLQCFVDEENDLESYMCMLWDDFGRPHESINDGQDGFVFDYGFIAFGEDDEHHVVMQYIDRKNYFKKMNLK
jgi:hypothetical protein